MIKIDRLSCPEVLKTGNVPDSEGERETKDAILFYKTLANHSLTYKKTGARGFPTKDSHSIYADREVREQLKHMFYGKCAYCESKIISIYSGDVEHFRPKGGYGTGNPLTKPGYYWLAADWDNLLFACPFCNQTNTHQILQNGTVIEVVLGKLNQFPLLTENFRLNHTHGSMYFTNPVSYKAAYDLEESERLLLKPCTDSDIEKYFEYEDLGVIVPAKGLNLFEVNRATTSITVYALQRFGLVQSREEKVIQIKAQIRRVEEAMINLNNHLSDSDEVITWFEGILRKELRILHQFKEPRMEYAGLARYLVGQYFENLV